MELIAKYGSKEEHFKFREEFIGFSGTQDENVDITNAEIVFVGYGIVAPEQKWDDYKGVDVTGKVLLMMNDDPPSEDPKFFGGKARTYYGRWTYKYEIAARKRRWAPSSFIRMHLPVIRFKWCKLHGREKIFRLPIPKKSR